MTETKRYYWLRFQEDFFKSKRIKKLRKLAGGDTFTIIYLKMQLESLATNGVLTYTGIEPTFAEEVALDIDEDPENVAVTISYLLKTGLIEEVEEGYQMPYVIANTGSETASTQRSREYREKKKMLQCNTNATQMQQLCNVEKEIEIDKEKDIDILGKSKRFTPPTIDEISSYINDKGYTVNAEKFFNYYQANGWMVGRNKMKDYKAAIRLWQTKEKPIQVYTTEEMNVEEIPLEELKERMKGKK